MLGRVLQASKAEDPLALLHWSQELGLGCPCSHSHPIPDPLCTGETARPIRSGSTRGSSPPPPPPPPAARYFLRHQLNRNKPHISIEPIEGVLHALFMSFFFFSPCLNTDVFTHTVPHLHSRFNITGLVFLPYSFQHRVQTLSACAGLPLVVSIIGTGEGPARCSDSPTSACGHRAPEAGRTQPQLVHTMDVTESCPSCGHPSAAQCVFLQSLALAERPKFFKRDNNWSR